MKNGMAYLLIVLMILTILFGLCLTLTMHWRANGALVLLAAGDGLPYWKLPF